MKIFIFTLLAGFAPVVWAQSTLSQQECERKLLEAEENRNESIYDQCGFNKETIAIDVWGKWAQEKKANQALFEIYKRYPLSFKTAPLYQKALEGGNGPALMMYGDQLYEKKEYPKAITAYTKALKTPHLTFEEKGHIGEKIGLLYLNPQSSYYNPKNGLPLMKKATEQRSALANNVMGVYSLFGLQGVEANEQEAFFYLWRSVLLGCSAAQENLGIYYLLYNKKITQKEAQEQINGKVFTCDSLHIDSADQVHYGEKKACDCKKVADREQFINPEDPYRFISNEEGNALVEDENGLKIPVQKGSTLPDGSTVQEIRKAALILLKNNQKKYLYLSPSEECLTYCKNKTQQKQEKKRKITPYHLSFTPKECADLLYYANQLVDTKLPFVGKEECGFTGNLQTANDLLLKE